jgi:hypothetical protein
MSHPAQPLSAPLQNGVRFLRDPLPAAPSARLTARFPLWEDNGHSHVPHTYPDGLGPAYPPVTAMSATGETRAPSGPLTFWFEPSASCDTAPSARWTMTAVAAIRMCWPYHRPSLRPPWCWQSRPHLAVRPPPSRARDTLSRELRTAGLLPPHVPVGSGGRTPDQILGISSYAYNEF